MTSYPTSPARLDPKGNLPPLTSIIVSKNGKFPTDCCGRPIPMEWDQMGNPWRSYDDAEELLLLSNEVK